MGDTVLDELGGLGHVVGGAPGGVGGAGAHGQRGQVEGTVDAAVGGRGGEGAGGRGGRELAAGHAVDVVVEHDHGEVDVPAGGVDQVVAADGGAVAVAGDDDDGELGLGHLDARGEGDGPAMGGVQGVVVHIAGGPGGAADTGDDDHLVAVKPQVGDGLGHVPHA